MLRKYTRTKSSTYPNTIYGHTRKAPWQHLVGGVFQRRRAQLPHLIHCLRPMISHRRCFHMFPHRCWRFRTIMLSRGCIIWVPVSIVFCVPSIHWWAGRHCCWHLIDRCLVLETMAGRWGSRTEWVITTNYRKQFMNIDRKGGDNNYLWRIR